MTLDEARNLVGRRFGVLPLHTQGTTVTHVRVSDNGWLVCDLDIAQSREAILIDLAQGIDTYKMEMQHRLKQAGIR